MHIQFGTFSVGDGFNIKLLLLMMPIVLIQLGLIVGALIDLFKRKKLKYGTKTVWVLVILFGYMIGPIVYFFLRGDEK